MNERDALTMLDRRMSEASVELRRAVDAALGDAPPSAMNLTGRPTNADDPSPVVRLDGPASPPRSRRRWLWAAAAAVIVVAGIAGVIAVGGGDDEAPPATTVDQPFLVPGWLPPGWAPVSASRADAPSVPPATVTVYGSSTAEDPWNGDVVAVIRTDASETFTPADGTPVDVAGHDATIDADAEMWVVTIPLEHGTLVVSGRGVSRDVVLGVAAAAVDDLPVEPALPSGMVEIAAGPLDMSGQPAAGGLSLVYGAESSANSVTITQRTGQAAELGLVRLLRPAPNTATEITVRGQPGLRVEAGSGTGSEAFPDIVQWIEPPGLLVTVWVEGLADDELAQFLGQLRTSTAGEIDELVDTYHEPPGTSDGVQDGEIVVAEGDRGDNHWRVTAMESAGSFEVSYEDEHRGFGFGTDSGAGSSVALEIDTAEAVDGRGETATIGIADPAISQVVVEAAGQSPLPLELYRSGELSRTVIVGFVPRAYVGGDVIGRDRTGREVARVSLER